MGGFGGGLLRADNAVRLISDNIKYRQLCYIGWLIVELEVLRKEVRKNRRGQGFVLWKIEGAGMMLRLQYN